MTRVQLAAALALASLAVSPASIAADKGKETAKTAADTLYRVKPDSSLFDFDYGPPQSPAMKLLGLSSESTPPSTSLTKFVLAVPTLFQKEGGQSVALDFAPAAIWEDRTDVSFARYVDEDAYLTRLGYRTRVSVAGLSGKDGGGDASKAVRSRLALGLSASLLDSADPLVTGRRGSDGASMLLGCLNAQTSDVQEVLRTTSAFTPDELAFSRKDYAFSRAWSYLSQAVPNFAAARKLLAPYVPGADVGAGAPVVQDAPPPAPVDPKIAKLIADAKARGEYNETVQALIDLIRAERQPKAPQDPQTRDEAAAAPVLTDAQLYELVRKEVRKNTSGEGRAVREAELAAANDKKAAEAFKASGVDAAIDRCVLVASRRARFSRDLDLGLGVTWRGEPGAMQDFNPAGQVVWAAFKLPLGVKFPEPDQDGVYGEPLDETIPRSAWMLAFSGRFGWGEYLATGDKTVPEFKADTIDAWVGLEWLSETKRFAAQYGWYEAEAREAAGRPFEKSGERYLATAQFRLPMLPSGTWLGLSYGNGYGTVASLDDETALVTISYTPPPPIGITGRD